MTSSLIPAAINYTQNGTFTFPDDFDWENAEPDELAPLLSNLGDNENVTKIVDVLEAIDGAQETICERGRTRPLSRMELLTISRINILRSEIIERLLKEYPTPLPLMFIEQP